MIQLDSSMMSATAGAAISSTIHPITQQVLERLQPPQQQQQQPSQPAPQAAAIPLSASSSSSSRTQCILQSLVRHLHAFVQDVQPTQDEWMMAIDFLTRTGQKCDDRRQEFILLSDVLGVSSLVVAINNDQPTNSTNSTNSTNNNINNVNNSNNSNNSNNNNNNNDEKKNPHAPTASTVQGPFHVPSDPAAMGDQLAHGPEQTRGELTLVQGVVRDATTGQPITNATLDVWQSDDLGQYDLQQPPRPQPQPPMTDIPSGTQLEKNLRGTFTTTEDGRYWFRTIRPAPYPVPTDGPVGELLRAMGRHPMRPAHIHFMVQAPPGYRKLVTHLFVKGDPYLDSDAVFGVKQSLIVDFVRRTKETAPNNNDGDGGGGEVYEVEFDVALVPETK